MNGKRTYSIYGLTLEVNQPLVGLLPGPPDCLADITASLEGELQSGCADPRHDALCKSSTLSTDSSGSQFWSTVSKTGQQHRLQYGRDAASVDCVLNSDASQIRLTWTPGVVPSDVAALLVHPLLGCALRLRGMVCLHGSVVSVGDRCIGILGPPGAGKSTAAAMIAAWGFGPLSDDVVALDDRPDGFWVQPGPSHLRLHHDSAAATFGAQTNLTQIWSRSGQYTDKGQLDARPNSFPGQALPLAAIYLLRPREQNRSTTDIKPRKPVHGLLALIGNTFASYMLDQPGRAHEFAVLRALAQTVPIREVWRADDIDLLETSCRAILQDAEALSADPPVSRCQRPQSTDR